VSTTTGFESDVPEGFEPIPDQVVAEFEEDMAPVPTTEVGTGETVAEPILPRRADRPGRRSRRSRKARLARTGLVVLVLGVTLSSFGLLPGHGWPLSLLKGGGTATATRRAGAAGLTGVQGADAERLAPPRNTLLPALWAFAEAKGLTLYVPTRSLLGIGYHEAATREGLAIIPLGTCVDNANRSRIRTPIATAGPNYVIMQTRHRRQGPTTAVDVAVPPGTTVMAPMTGTVMQVTTYRLYRYWIDYRVVIRPAGNARLRVIMIHLTDIRVRRGSRVVVGLTPLGVPRVFPFKSDINDYVGAGVPHVHLEVKEIGPPRRTA
jgi:murein DD-endopeptidase MepM/ murein hydrolase activator NlpD